MSSGKPISNIAHGPGFGPGHTWGSPPSGRIATPEIQLRRERQDAALGITLQRVIWHLDGIDPAGAPVEMLAPIDEVVDLLEADATTEEPQLGVPGLIQRFGVRFSGEPLT